jgi:hypothetical protein
MTQHNQEAAERAIAYVRSFPNCHNFHLEEDGQSWDTGAMRIYEAFLAGAATQKEVQTALNSLSELIRTVSRLSNKYPNVFEAHDMERLERAKESLRNTNWSKEPIVIRSATGKKEDEV